MALSSFLVLSHLVLLLHSAAEAEYKFEAGCPRSFNCGVHGPISFPFANPTYSKCGLATVSCDESLATIQLGPNVYDVISPLQSDTIRIHDAVLQDHIYNHNCDYFNDLTSFPDSPFISFTSSPNLTLFKCAKTPQADDYFRGNYTFTECPDDTLYYMYPPPDHQWPIYGSLPPNCSVIHRPLLPPDREKNANHLFALFAAEFFLEFNATEACDVCHQSGGRCLNDKYEFQCLIAKEGRNHLKLILATAVPPSVIVALIILVLCYRSKFACGESMAFWKKKAKNNRDIEAFLKNYGSLAPKRYSYSDVKKMTNSFKFKLGQGGYGCVYKGKLQNGGLAAIKVLNEPKGSGEEFINEVASISRTSHVNIVTLLGFCFEGSKRALIYEFLPNGSLEKFIYDRNSLTNRQLGWETLYQIAVGIARGLEYLHQGCNMQILHFDIKPHNILLDEDFSPKISDFGLAKLCPGKESVISMLGARGTAGYIAPEVFSRSFGVVSHKSDVYSYGMMIIEMVGGRKNIVVRADRISEIYFPHWIHKRLELDQELGLHGIVNDEQKESVRKMIIVGLWCIQINPSDRPPMSRVVDMLKGSLETLDIPPAPFLSSPSRSPADSSTTLVA